jgi:hypothetical protein
LGQNCTRLKLQKLQNNLLITTFKVLPVNKAKDNLDVQLFMRLLTTISMLNVELGERVLGTQQMTGTEILRVANLNNMEVEVDVNENDIVKIKVGMRLMLK